MQTTYKYEDAVKESEIYFGNSLSAKACVDKYLLRDNKNQLLELTPRDLHSRIATELARIEKDKFKNPLSYDEIFSYLDNFGKIIPQGSPLSGIGNKHQYLSLSNCFVLPQPDDSYGGIMHVDEHIVQISKRRGGVGISLDKLRPRGTPTQNSSRTSTGIVSWMERYSNSIREVGQAGRRGALMLTLNVHHPEILNFITAKNDKSKVTGANISVQYTDEFLSAVENDTDYEQRWPIDSATPEISVKVRAKDIWDAAVHNAWANAEPGLQFIDNVLRESPSDCYADVGFRTITSNPCSEIFLSILDSCRLLVLNLMQFVKDHFTSKASFDFEGFKKAVVVAQRLMDDIVDLELECIDRLIAKIKSDPEPEYIKRNELDMWIEARKVCANGRRTGTGITALGDTLAALNIKYGTEESISMTELIYRELKLSVYRSSVEMAKELGPFPVWDFAKEKNNPFLNRIKNEDPDLYREMKKYGRRNIACLTTAPVGTVSTQASLIAYKDGVAIKYHGTTSGIEPLFEMKYTRRKKGNPGDSGFRTDFVDDSGDHWMEFDVYHPGVQLWMDVTGETDESKSPYAGACSSDIDWQNRVRLQAVAQRHIDHSISSTINLPENVKESVVADIYLESWRSGCKGMTVYRQNCRTGVLIEKKTGIQKTDAPKRPKQLECEIHHITVKGNPYFVIVGLYDGDPYEVFAGRNGFIDKKIKKGVTIKKNRQLYKVVFEDDSELSPITAFCDPDEEVVTRLISSSLRHGADIEFLVHQLEKSKGQLDCFSKSIARALKKYIKDGAEVTGEECGNCGGKLVRQEGCKTCQGCGWSKC